MIQKDLGRNGFEEKWRKYDSYRFKIIAILKEISYTVRIIGQQSG